MLCGITSCRTSIPTRAIRRSTSAADPRIDSSSTNAMAATSSGSHNGHIGVREYSSVDEIPPSTDGAPYERAPDGTFLPRVLERVRPRSDDDRWWSGAISGAQRFPNGNTMIVDGPVGRIFEITSTRANVWEYVKRTFDAERYARDDPAAARPSGRTRS
jgi:hypothetical protein